MAENGRAQIRRRRIDSNIHVREAAQREQLGPVNGEYSAVRPDRARDVRFTNARADGIDLGERIGSEVPAVNLTILARGDDTVSSRVDGARVHAPFSDGMGVGGAEEFRIRGRADHRQQLTHFDQAGGGRMRVKLRGTGIQQRDLVDAVAIAARVIVVLAEDEVGRSAAIAGKHVRGNDCGGVIPAEAARRFAGLQIGAEVEQEATRVVVGIGVHTHEYVAIRADHRRGGGVVKQNRPVVGVAGVHQKSAILRGKIGRVEAQEIANRAAASPLGGDIQGAAIAAQGRGRVVAIV